jgi:hypothetical protein
VGRGEADRRRPQDEAQERHHERVVGADGDEAGENEVRRRGG